MIESRNSSAERRTMRLYRNVEQGKLFGVCAGLADYFGFSVTATRIVALVSLVFFMPATLLVYLGLALLLPRQPPASNGGADMDAFRYRLRYSPQAMLSDLRHRCRELDLRLQRIERYVTSPRFQLDREFRELHRDAR